MGVIYFIISNLLLMLSAIQAYILIIYSIQCKSFRLAPAKVTFSPIFGKRHYNDNWCYFPIIDCFISNFLLIFSKTQAYILLIYSIQSKSFRLAPAKLMFSLFFSRGHFSDNWCYIAIIDCVISKLLLMLSTIQAYILLIYILLLLFLGQTIHTHAILSTNPP